MVLERGSVALKLKFLILTCLASSLLIFLAVAYGAEEFEVKSFEIMVYKDGYAHIVQKLSVNETAPFVTVSILTSNPEGAFLSVIGDGEILDYEVTGSNLTIYTLGVTEVTIEYDTPDLTWKEGRVWTLKFNLPYKARVTLPENASIIYFNEVPEGIESSNGRITLTLKPGNWEVSYLLELPVAPTTPPPTTTGTSTTPFTTTPMLTTTPTVPPTTPPTAAPSYGFEAFYIAVIGGVTITLTFTLLYVFKSRKERVLDPREREVLEFLSRKGGRALEAEVREVLKLPRSTAWRILRRLEKKGLVEVRKVGFQNEVKLVK